MLVQRLLAALLQILAVVVAFAVCALWIADAQSGTVSAWAILPFFWSAAALAVLGHYLARWRAPVTHYLARHKPLAGPREGAELPS